MLHGEFIPATDKNSCRLFVVLHGLGDSPTGWRWLPGALDLPWLNYLLVQAPDDYYGGYSWFDYPGDIAPGIHRSRELLETGLRYPHRLAGIVGISGWVFAIDSLIRDLTPVARSQRLLVTHGLQDPLLPIGEVREQIRQLKAAGMDVVWREFPKEHTIHGTEEISVIRDFVRAGYMSK